MLLLQSGGHAGVECGGQRSKNLQPHPNVWIGGLMSLNRSASQRVPHLASVVVAKRLARLAKSNSECEAKGP